MAPHPCADHTCDHCVICDVQGVCCASIPSHIRADMRILMTTPGSIDVLRDCLSQLAGGVPLSTLSRLYIAAVAVDRQRCEKATTHPVRHGTASDSDRSAVDHEHLALPPGSTPPLRPFTGAHAEEPSPLRQQRNQDHGTT